MNLFVALIAVALSALIVAALTAALRRKPKWQLPKDDDCFR